VSNDVMRARELAVQAANGTLGPQDKQAIQLEITQIQQSVLDLSNSKIGSAFLFSGSKSTDVGYVAAVSSAVDPGAYKGNAAPILREITPGVTISVNASAQATFDPIFSALSKLQAGLVNQATAPATSTAAVLTGSAPLTPISTSGSLVINGVSVALSSGDTAAQTVAKINGATGLGATGSVTASLDASSHLVLTSNTVGSDATVNVSAATPNSIYADLGMTPSSVSGLDNAAGIQAKLQESLTALDGAVDSVGVTRSTVGAKMNRLTTLQGQQEAVNTNLTGLLSQVKDVDIAQAITAYTTAQTVYTASLKSASQILQSSLLDYLR
jgi:flagellar hook-associated protein 3